MELYESLSYFKVSGVRFYGLFRDNEGNNYNRVCEVVNPDPSIAYISDDFQFIYSSGLDNHYYEIYNRNPKGDEWIRLYELFDSYYFARLMRNNKFDRFNHDYGDNDIWFIDGKDGLEEFLTDLVNSRNKS